MRGRKIRLERQRVKRLLFQFAQAVNYGVDPGSKGHLAGKLQWKDILIWTVEENDAVIELAAHCGFKGRALFSDRRLAQDEAYRNMFIAARGASVNVSNVR